LWCGDGGVAKGGDERGKVEAAEAKTPAVPKHPLTSAKPPLDPPWGRRHGKRSHGMAYCSV
jgi:hypothetical protein